MYESKLRVIEAWQVRGWKDSVLQKLELNGGDRKPGLDVAII